MKASQFIDKLQSLINKHGDLPVNVFDPDDLEQGKMTECQAHITISCDENDNPVSFTVCDSETYMGLK